MTVRSLLSAVLLVSTATLAAAQTAGPLPSLGVGSDGRYLVRPDGSPVLYLADTAWELFHRPNREQAREYLRVRRQQGFTAVQAVALAELDGITEPNAYGDLPLVEADPARPATTPGADPGDPAQYDYWDHVDFVVDEANRQGLYLALLPTWGRWLGVMPTDQRVVTADNARAFGVFLGARYANRSVIWVLGGDRPGAGFEEVWRAMAEGIAQGAAGRVDHDALLMTFHPRGGQTSSTWFHAEPWLDFNMQQTGHGPVAAVRPWSRVEADYRRVPVKPVVEGEPLYEDHPIGFAGGVRQHGFSTDAHVRQRLYWAVFAGAAGVAYGHHSVWQMYAAGRRPVNGPLLFWHEALDRPGATQVRHLRTLFESRPARGRAPDPSVVRDTLAAAEHVSAMRGPDHAMVYSAAGIPFTVELGRISGGAVRAWWFNPRNGTSTLIGTFANRGTREFRPQYQGLGSDWVLVLDDAGRDYPGPGREVAAPPP